METGVEDGCGSGEERIALENCWSQVAEKVRGRIPVLKGTADRSTGVTGIKTPAWI